MMSYANCVMHWSAACNGVRQNILHDIVTCMQMLGQTTHTCSPNVQLKHCTERFPDDRSFTMYLKQLSNIDKCALAMHFSFMMIVAGWTLTAEVTHCLVFGEVCCSESSQNSLLVLRHHSTSQTKGLPLDHFLTAGFPAGSMCLHLMHDAFGARTEELMHQLSASSEHALQATSHIQSSLDSVGSRLAGVSSAVGMLQHQQQQLSEMGASALAQSASILGVVASLEGNLHAVQMAGVSLYSFLHMFSHHASCTSIRCPSMT